jgi:hypothetical protein
MAGQLVLGALQLRRQSPLMAALSRAISAVEVRT